MQFLDLANHFIPGYALLPADTRSAFEKSDAGTELLLTCGQLEAIATDANQNRSWLEWLLHEETNIDVAIIAAKMRFISYCEKSAEYQHILKKINHIVLNNQYQARVNGINKLYQRPLSSDKTLDTEEEQRQLTLYILICLNNVCDNHISPLKMNAFNSHYANIIAHKILDAYIRNDLPISINQWLKYYEEELQINLVNKLGNAHKPSRSSRPSPNGNITGAISTLLSKSIGEENRLKLYDKLNKTADAHAFIQKTGFATQNETSYLSWLDVYNYHRASDSIVGAKHALFKFFQPFSALFAEYNDITYRENNIARQMFRTFMPMFIVSAVIISIAALLSAIVLPEIAFMILLIPTLYVGLMLASTYVDAKNSLYHIARNAYYGGQYAIPEYQVNERMCRGLNGQIQANSIRDYYIKEIKLCYETEAMYQHKPSGTLSDHELIDRKENAARKDMLRLEWYDIHSNVEVGYDNIRTIAANRFQLDAEKACKPIQQTLQKEIPLLVKSIGRDIKTGLDVGYIAANNGNQFFTPSCLKQYEKATHLLTLKSELTNTVFANI